MSTASRGERIVSASKALYKSPEWMTYFQIQELGFTFSLHEVNYRELKQFTSALIGDDEEATLQILQLWDVDKREQLETTLQETSRRLHNFLASAKTLVDHTRNHIKSMYAASPFKIEYEKHLGELVANNPVCTFLHELRNYNLHRQLPVIRSQLSWERGRPLKSQVLLDLDALLEWKRWSRPSKEYVAAAGAEMPVGKLADEYMMVITTFYDWLQTRERQIHERALAKLKRRLERLRALEAQTS